MAKATVEAKKTYTVTAPLRHDGFDYQPGASVEMLPSQAALIPWAVENPAS